MPLTPSMTLKDMTFEIMRYSVPLIINFNKQTQPLIHTLPIKVSNILSPVLCCAVLCCAVLCCAVLCCAVLCSALLYSTLLYSALLYSTLLYCTLLYSTALYSTVLYSTVLYCTALYCTLLYCTVLYCTVLYCTVPLDIIWSPESTKLCVVSCISSRSYCLQLESYLLSLHHLPYTLSPLLSSSFLLTNMPTEMCYLNLSHIPQHKPSIHIYNYLARLI